MYLFLKIALEEKFHFKKDSCAKADLTKNIPYSLPLLLYDLFRQTSGKRISGTEKKEYVQNCGRIIKSRELTGFLKN